MTQGGQIANMPFRMFGQITNIIFYVLFILFWVLCGLMLMYRAMADLCERLRMLVVYDAGSSARYYSLPAGIHHSVLRPVAGIYLQNKYWPINILSGAESSCGLVSPLLPWFSCYLYRDVLHRQLGAGPPGNGRVRMRTPAGASFPISPKKWPAR